MRTSAATIEPHHQQENSPAAVIMVKEMGANNNNDSSRANGNEKNPANANSHDKQTLTINAPNDITLLPSGSYKLEVEKLPDNVVFCTIVPCTQTTYTSKTSKALVQNQSTPPPRTTRDLDPIAPIGGICPEASQTANKYGERDDVEGLVISRSASPPSPEEPNETVCSDSCGEESRQEKWEAQDEDDGDEAVKEDQYIVFEENTDTWDNSDAIDWDAPGLNDRFNDSNYPSSTSSMGNICSRSANKPDAFEGPGRTLGSSSAAAPKNSSVPSPFKTTVGRTLGGESSNTTSSSNDDAAAKARQAAEERYAKAQQGSGNKGKLGQKLDEQKRKTQNDLLKEGADNERRARDADAAAQARSYN